MRTRNQLLKDFFRSFLGGEQRRQVHPLYPNSPLHRREPAEHFVAEIESMCNGGFQVSLFSLEDFQSGGFRASPQFHAKADVLYRGWMLSGNEYERLVEAIAQNEAQAFTDLKSSPGSHHLPNWYPAIADLTPETRIYPVDCDLESEL